MLKSNLTYKIRRKAVAHYDVQSITASLNSPVVVSQKNTTTGASAASKNTCVDQGDGKSNSLVMSCPCFRNEIGTEKEVAIVLNRLTASQSQAQTDDSLIIHCPSMASGLSLLEDCSDRWEVNICPYQKMLTNTNTISSSSSTTTTNINNGAEQNKCFIIENCDIGASYYRIHFYGLEHQNWFGIDDNLGPIAISIRKERVNSPKPSTNSNCINNSNGNGLYSGNSTGSNTSTSIAVASNTNHNNSNIANGQSNGQINLTTSSSSSSNTSSHSSSTTSSSSSSSSVQNNNNNQINNRIKHQYRIIIRTSQLSVLRGTVYEDYIPALASSRHSNHNNHHAKEVLEYIAPEFNLSSLRLGVSNADEQLLKLDEQVITRTYKVGVLYCKAGQGTEEEMYNNENASPQFEEFLSCLGEQVRLKGFDKYRAGLDSKTDTTGLHSIYANYHDCEIMFHVSTLLPYTPNNKQQLLRKRHIGNDIVTIVFQEPGALPFTPRSIRSHFQHVFIIVRVLPPEPGNCENSNGNNNINSNCNDGTKVDGVGVNGNGYENNTSGVTRYAIAVTRSKEVPVFGPPIPNKGIFTRGKELTEFLLAKIINGENAAHKSEKFSNMAQRTRHGYLKDLATNYVTSTTLNDISCGNSASAKLVSTIFGSSKRRGSHRQKDFQFIGDAVIRGAIVWEVTVNDYGQSKLVDCFVGISYDTLIIIEESTKQTLFACPNNSIIGWDASHSNYIEIFCHQGECIRLNCKDQGLDLDEISEIKTRLASVTQGCQTKELILKRNNHGQLGFHIEPDGIVTDVEKFAFAWNAGLRPNCRIVKICEVVTATLNYIDMIDYLKTSSTVKITILDPNPEGSPKKGCNLAQCPYLTFMAGGSSINNNNNNNMVLRDSQLQPTSSLNSVNHGGDYENIGIMIEPKKYPLSSDFKNGLHHQQQQRFHYSTGTGPTGLMTAAVTPGALHQTNKNTIGLPLGNYPTPFATSQTSKSLTVSPEKEKDLLNNKITPSSSSSNIYSNLSSSQLHFSSSSFVSGLTRFTNSKREPLRPKSTTNECTSLSSSSSSGSSSSTTNTSFVHSNNHLNNAKHSTLPGSTSITLSPPSLSKGLSKDHLVLHHLGNVMLSRSELCLASKNCLPLPNVKPTSSPTNQSMTLSNNIIPPLSSSSSAHTRSHSHHFTKIGDKFTTACSALGLPYTHSPNSSLSRTGSVLKHPGSSSAVEALSAVSPSPSEWSNSAWSSPRITRRVFEPSSSRTTTGGLIVVSGGGGGGGTGVAGGIGNSQVHGGTNLSSTNNNNSSNLTTSYPSATAAASSREIFVNNRGKPVLSANHQHPLSTSSSATNYSNARTNLLSDRIKNRNGSHKSSGSSCSGSSTSTSTLQEDLLKLISPDFLIQKTNPTTTTNPTGDCESNDNTSGGETSTSQYSTPYSSLERSSTKEMPCKDTGQVILTVAQPAQVILSQPSSPTDFSKSNIGGNGNISGIGANTGTNNIIINNNKDISPSRSSSALSRSQTIGSLPLSRSSPSSSSTGDRILTNLSPSSSPEEDVTIDWPTLVETATKAMALSESGISGNGSGDGISDNALEQWVREFGANGGANLNGHLAASGLARRIPGENLKELEETVKKLQYDLVKEQSDKAKLAELVKSLEKENSRLQEEQKTAILQLKTLTDFFFNR